MERRLRHGGQAMRTAARAERGPATWLGRVVGHRRVGWDLAVIEVAASEPVPYRAGQYVSVETPQRPRLWPYLSPANAPREDGRLEFHVRAVPGGWVEPGHRGALAGRRHVADRTADGPHAGSPQQPPERAHGGRRYRLRAHPCAAGRPRRGDGQPRTQVFIGGRTWDDLHDFAPLRRLSYDNPWLDVVPVVERDDPGNGGAEIGTLSDVVTRYGSWADHDVTVCGSPAMIRSTVSQMLVAGTPLDRIASTRSPWTNGITGPVRVGRVGLSSCPISWTPAVG